MSRILKAGWWGLTSAGMLLIATAASAQDPKPEPAPAAPAPATAPPTTTASPSGSGSGWSAEVAHPDNTSGITLDEKQTELVNQVSQYFSALDNLKGAFVQTGADNKRMKGKFFLKRPGRFRFNYSLPSKQVIISDGNYLAIQDHDLNNEDRVALDQTPFRLLLRKDVNLIRDARIVEVQDSADTLVVAIEDKNPDNPGKIKLFMSRQPELELKEWVTTDAQGLDTRVEISGLDKTAEIDAKLFVITTLTPKRLP